MSDLNWTSHAGGGVHRLNAEQGAAAIVSRMSQVDGGCTHGVFGGEKKNICFFFLSWYFIHNGIAFLGAQISKFLYTARFLLCTSTMSISLFLVRSCGYSATYRPGRCTAAFSVVSRGRTHWKLIILISFFSPCGQGLKLHWIVVAVCWQIRETFIGLE